eukprot:TRINITY_DN33337_c0_g1_i1.p1 TRINITY_DN33337_c0_g1~~TRINITY_DN33337_c0_g1_i1.p1  ORF type:complete len:428 (-),score=76.94 TRINITY_DN33337_c0_g1_i1:49-1332(-)
MLKHCKAALPLWTFLLGICVGALLLLQRSNTFSSWASCLSGPQRQDVAASLVVTQDAAALSAEAPKAGVLGTEVQPEIHVPAAEPATAAVPALIKPVVTAPPAAQEGSKEQAVQFRCLDEPACKHVRPRCKNKAVGPGQTNCPRDLWLAEMASVDPDPGKFIVNIGCNVGEDVIKYLMYWDQERFWDMRKWQSMIGSGFCRNGINPRRPPAVKSKERPQALCVEAVPKTTKNLHNAAKRSGYSEEKNVGKLHIVHAAVTQTAEPGDTALFADAPSGYEQGGIDGQNSNPLAKGKFDMVQVPKKTVDVLVEEFAFPRVDLLLVDTEGHDPAVLLGAQKTLESVRYLEFEVHRDVVGSTWENTTVFSVVEMLSMKGFDCYWAGNTGKLASITRCFETRAFEARGMFNIACVKRSDVWWPVLERFWPDSS